jgi:predicted Fe-S protein YdhL (DUF1289 family)
MNFFRQSCFWLVFFVAGQSLIFPLRAENSTNSSAPVKLFSTPANLIPPIPAARSPVDFFRDLLAMTPQQRKDYLTNRPPEVRERILAKVREYLALDPDERELRLRATELRWYLMPLLRDSSTNRAARLAQVPDDIRDLARARLMQWEILPPPLQNEFLENERTLHYFSHVDATNNSAAGDWHRGPSDTEQARWNALSEDERQRITTQFNQFFELTPAEKEKALGTLSGVERAQMEKTLTVFDTLPPQQRAQCVRAFTKFAGMSGQERIEFLKNAERWAQMPPAERKAWRDLVAHVPQWPPLPPALMPPMPPKVQPHFRPVVATNLN